MPDFSPNISIDRKKAIDFKSKMETLDNVIDAYNSSLNAANMILSIDQVSDLLLNSKGEGMSASDYNVFTMAIDRWGSSKRKVGQ